MNAIHNATTIELNELTPDERHTLARKTGTDPVYLWQCGAGIRAPSLELAEKLMKYEVRLTVTSLLAPRRRRKARQKKNSK